MDIITAVRVLCFEQTLETIQLDCNNSAASDSEYYSWYYYYCCNIPLQCLFCSLIWPRNHLP